MNIYEQQASNKRQTAALMLLFFVFFLFLGLGFDVFVLGMPVPGTRVEAAGPVVDDGYAGNYGRYAGLRGYYAPVRGRTNFPWGTMAGVIAAAVIMIASLVQGPEMVLSSAMARRADPADPKERQLLNVVEEISIAAGVPMPQVYVVPDADPNAFATGFSPDKSFIAFTRGSLDALNREELQGVAAHEMSHIRNYDIRLVTMISALCGAIVLLSDFAKRSMRGGIIPSSGSSRGKGKGGGAMMFVFAIWLVLLLLAPVISRLMAVAVSRRREYLADASGAELTRNPLALARALEKIRGSSAPTAALNHDGVAHMCIADPRGSYFDDKEGFAADLLSTHPPLEKRILALKMMAYQPTNA